MLITATNGKEPTMTFEELAAELRLRFTGFRVDLDLPTEEERERTLVESIWTRLGIEEIGEAVAELKRHESERGGAGE